MTGEVTFQDVVDNSIKCNRKGKANKAKEKAAEIDTDNERGGSSKWGGVARM